MRKKKNRLLLPSRCHDLPDPVYLLATKKNEGTRNRRERRFNKRKRG